MSTKLATIIADFTTQLTTKIGIGDTLASLASFVDDDGVALPTGNYFFTIDGNNAQKEHIFCAFNAGALTAIYSVSRQGVQTSGAARLHRIGATVTITDFANLLYMMQYFSGALLLDHTVPLKYDGTATINNSNQLATKAYADGIAIAGGSKADSTTIGISKLSLNPVDSANPIAVGDNDLRVSPVSLASVTANIVAALAGTGTPNGTTGKYVTNDDTGTSGSSKVLRLSVSGRIPTGIATFGGTGADGALAISSGTTTIDLGGAAIFTKNYTSISITGTAVLAFINPNTNGTIVILKSQGNVTLTSSATPMIDASGLGGATIAAATAGNAGTNGNQPNSNCWNATDMAGGGGAQGGGAAGAAGLGKPRLITSTLTKYGMPLIVGASGGGGSASASGGTGTAIGGTGGAGGGGLIIECGGALNFTTTSGISVAGKNGGAGGNGTGNTGNTGGGGGGGGGFCVILYNTLTASTGTITISGGSGGAQGTGQTGTNCAGGGGGASQINNGTIGQTGAGGGQGGAGGTGWSLVAANTEFL